MPIPKNLVHGQYYRVVWISPDDESRVELDSFCINGKLHYKAPIRDEQRIYRRILGQDNPFGAWRWEPVKEVYEGQLLVFWIAGNKPSNYDPIWSNPDAAA